MMGSSNGLITIAVMTLLERVIASTIDDSRCAISGVSHCPRILVFTKLGPSIAFRIKSIYSVCIYSFVRHEQMQQFAQFDCRYGLSKLRRFREV